MTDYTTLVERYLAAWNETDPDSRAKLVADLWTENGGYTDPLAQVSGHEAISAVIAGAQSMFAGLVFSSAGPVDGHHNLVRFTWNLGPAGQEPIVVGFDVAVLAEDGRIQQVNGFLDKVPA